MDNQFTRLFEVVRAKKPLVHHITNYVTVNDCANITLAIGASPIMADAIEEAREIAAISSAVVLNMGTLNSRTAHSMIEAGKSANQHGIPVVFDPVGAGASTFRNDTALLLLDQVRLSVIRGNISEIRFISGLSAHTKGVDAAAVDADSESKQIAASLAKKLECVVAITGKADTVSDGERTVTIANGHQALSSITGTGCMCSSLIGSFCGAVPTAQFAGTVAALLSMGIAGEIAHEKAGQLGNGHFRIAMMDAISQMSGATVEKRGIVNEY